MPLTTRTLFDIWNANGWPEKGAWEALNEQDQEKWRQAAKVLHKREINTRRQTLTDTNGWLSVTLRDLTNNEINALKRAIEDYDKTRP